MTLSPSRRTRPSRSRATTASGVELGCRTRLFGDESERTRAPLAEGALEPPLLAEWLVALPAARASARERADAAARHSRQAHGRAEIHERLGAPVGELAARALADARHVHVHGKYRPAEGEAADGVRRVAADSGKLGEILGPAMSGDMLRRPVQVDRAPVVAEPLPRADDLRERRSGERLQGRPPLEPGREARHDALDLRLLEHDLRDEDRVRVASPPPGQVAAVLLEPGSKPSLGGHRTTE